MHTTITRLNSYVLSRPLPVRSRVFSLGQKFYVERNVCEIERPVDRPVKSQTTGYGPPLSLGPTHGRTNLVLTPSVKRLFSRANTCECKWHERGPCETESNSPRLSICCVIRAKKGASPPSHPCPCSGRWHSAIQLDAQTRAMRVMAMEVAVDSSRNSPNLLRMRSPAPSVAARRYGVFRHARSNRRRRRSRSRGPAPELISSAPKLDPQ